ncbi:hypothetical protein DAPPUDRAFT_113432 [Daphnia pulex]|uniref:Uncharacterized protein n=1 Tax=Daphnia pulex TaxID=6669 RepID=E9HF05_DAPPU|nr:hypothetical protein DAPPUDRAFT_113432 [Daphnia pulex]|eukprot:EFX69686.1 hypothetical protein DAPPUDRAFT_113432 [Daphnia pulex]
MSVRRNGRQVAGVIEKLRPNHNKDAIRGRNKPDPSSETTKLRKRNEMFERAELLSKDNYKAQIIMFIHFPNTKQSTTYGKAFGNVAQSFLDSHKSVDVSSHVFPGHTSKEVGPRNCSDPGETVVEDVFENTETLVTSEKSVIEIDFDEGEEELTNLDMVLQKYGNFEHYEVVTSQTTFPDKEPLQALVAGEESVSPSGNPASSILPTNLAVSLPRITGATLPRTIDPNPPPDLNSMSTGATSSLQEKHLCAQNTMRTVGYTSRTPVGVEKSVTLSRNPVSYLPAFLAPTPPPDIDSGPTGDTSSARKALRCYQKTSRVPVGVEKSVPLSRNLASILPAVLVPTPPPIDSGPTGDTGQQAQNTVGTLGAKRKSSASTEIRKSDRRPKKKSEFEGETNKEEQCQAQPCKLPKRTQTWEKCDGSCQKWFHIRRNNSSRRGNHELLLRFVATEATVRKGNRVAQASSCFNVSRSPRQILSAIARSGKFKRKIAKSVFYFQKLEVDEDICSSSSSSDENDESPDCSFAEEEERDGASEEME